MFGKHYVLDFVIQKYKADQHELAYKIYITDSLKVITENTARFAGGSSMGIRYREIIDSGRNEPQRTSEDIISSISAQLEEIGGKEE